MSVTAAALDAISTVLGVPAETEGSMTRFALSNEESGRRIALEIAPEVTLPSGDETSVVSVYSTASFLQLHGVERVLPAEDLGEVLFLAREGERVSGLMVEREAGCSLYANVDARLLSADFTALPAEVMSSAVMLSLGETLFE